jgi:hypothetical protein
MDDMGPVARWKCPKWERCFSFLSDEAGVSREKATDPQQPLTV